MKAPTLEEAIRFAAARHEGQTLKNGDPFILHPLFVMSDKTLTTYEERVTAVLHDVVEDCGVTFDELRALGYGEEIIEALDCLTKRQGETYEDFIERIRTGCALARKVKLADLRHNSDLSRLPRITERDLARHERYARATRVLEEVVGTA